MVHLARRRFLESVAATGALAAWSGAAHSFGPNASRAATPRLALNGNALRKFVQPLPLPGAGIVVATPAPGDAYRFIQRPIARQLHPDLPPTPLFAYDDGSGLGGQAGSFGMAVVAQRGEPVTFAMTNGIAAYPEWIPVDTRLTPLGTEMRTLTHLHGGFVTGRDDGNPTAFPYGFGFGETQTMRYPNAQPATLLWFHDHAIGATRLNVFAGLAAAYVIRDELDTGLEPNPIGLHQVEIVSVDGRRIRVRNLEALDGTPIVDLKPVLK